MSSTSQRPVSRFSAVKIFYLLALGSGVMRTISVGFDIVALNTILPNPIVFGFMSQWVSFAVTFLAIALLSFKWTRNGKKTPLGYSLDPDFGSIGILPRTPMIYLLLAGTFAGISTFFYYFLAEATDASTVLPFGQLVIIYLLFGDLLAEKDTPTVIEIQCVISILLGVLLVGVSPGGFDLVTLLIVLVPMNISAAFVTYFQRKVKRYEIEPGLRVDSLNARLWSLLFLNLIFSAFSFPLLPVNALEVMIATFVPLFWIMVGSSLTIFLSLVMYIRALGRGSMAVVNSLSSISVVLGIPLTLIGNLIIPGAFGETSSDPFLWTLKIFGVILVMIGVASLEATEVRAIVLIKVKSQTGDILPDLYDIKGVVHAAAVAGSHDYILQIKSRSLAKTRNNIIRKVQLIPEVKDIETLVVLKDYR